MRDIVTPHQFYPALQALLGLPDHCVSFELRAAAGQVGVTVTCEHYVALDAADIKKLESVFSEFELVRKPVPAPDKWQQPTTVRDPLLALADALIEFDAAMAQAFGFDVWMRQRTERAHAEFMSRTSRLPA